MLTDFGTDMRIYKIASSILTWAQIQDEEDPEGKNHDLKLICVKCANTRTCRCSKPKREFKGLCDECVSPNKDKQLLTEWFKNN